MTDTRRSDAAERRGRALGLRRAGATYRDIARQIDVSPARAYGLVQEGLSAVVVDNAEALRALEGERLDIAQSALWREVIAGNLKAIDTFIRLSARRSRLFGLDLGSDLSVSVEVREAYQAEVERFLESLGRP